MLSHLFRAVRRTISVDPFSLNYDLCSERINLQSYYNTSAISGYPYLGSCWTLLKLLLKAPLVALKSRARRLQPKIGGIALVTHTQNNTAALEPIRQIYPEDCYYIGYSDKQLLSPSVYVAAWSSLPFLPVFIIRAILSSPYERRSLRYALDVTFLSYGYFLHSLLWLKKSQPRLVVIANDHSMIPRCICAAARHCSIPTTYIQHAQVSDRFPPLKFDYACLDGMKALEQYAKAGDISSVVFLTGMPKSTGLTGSINRNQQVSRVGICLNALDNLPQAQELIQTIRTTFPKLELHWRPHPSMRDSYPNMVAFGQTYEVHFSNPSQESFWQFLGKIDALVAGNSSVHLEATLMDVVSVLFDFGAADRDPYGFLRNGLISRLDTSTLLSSLETWQRNKPSVRHKAAMYCADIGTPYEGQPELLLKHALSSILEGSIPPNIFSKIPFSDVSVYQPSSKQPAPAATIQS